MVSMARSSKNSTWLTSFVAITWAIADDESVLVCGEKFAVGVEDADEVQPICSGRSFLAGIKGL